MNIDFREIATATMVLFAVIDIVGSIPVIIGLRTKFGQIQSGKSIVSFGGNYDSISFCG